MSSASISEAKMFFGFLVVVFVRIIKTEQKDRDYFNAVKWSRFIPFLSNDWKQEKLISQINEWGMRRQRNANKASKQQIAVWFTGDRESEQCYLICVLYTSLPVMGNSILFTGWSLYESHAEENLGFESFEWLSQSSEVLHASEPRPLQGERSDLFNFASGGRGYCGWFDGLQLSLMAGRERGSWFKTSAVACLTGLLTPSTPRTSKNTVSVYTDAIFIRGSCTLLYCRVVFIPCWRFYIVYICPFIVVCLTCWGALNKILLCSVQWQ